MKKGIYISIKPKYTKLIENKTKNYEFRKYIPKKGVDILYVYESFPTCELKYIIEVNNILKYPEKITKEGYGNDEFNNGLKQSKYAYEIFKVYKLKNPLPLKTLKEKYNFNAPQSYAYDEKYIELTKYIMNCDKIKI